MNSDRIAGNWKQIKGRMQSEWAKLTDDDLGQLEGHREYLAGKVQERYGIAKDQAEAQVKKFEESL